MPTDITAAVLRGANDPFTIESLVLEDPQANEVLVKMAGVGLCHTDLLSRELPPEFFVGPTVHGHEGSGVVAGVGSDVTKVAPGDHVVLTFNYCGACRACDKNRFPHCDNFLVYNMMGARPDGSKALKTSDGDPVGSHYFGQSSFASHALATEQNVVKVDSTLPLELLGPLGCGVQTGAGAVLNTLGVESGSAIAIWGAGALGLSAVMAAKVAGAEIIVAIDRHQSRLDKATALGATHTVKVPDVDAGAEIQQIVLGGVDYGFDSTGNAGVVRTAFDSLNGIGTLAVAGVGLGTLELDMMSLVSGRTLTGVMEGDSVPDLFIPQLADLFAKGEFPFDELITTFALDQINEAERASAAGEVIKAVFVFE